MIGELRARAWRIGAAAGAAASLALAVSLGVTLYQKRGIENDLLQAAAALTRLEGDLATCRRNTTSLEAAIGESNDRINRISEDGVRRQAAAAAAVEAARAASAATQSRLDRLLAAPLSGATACDRLEEVDRAVLESLR